MLVKSEFSDGLGGVYDQIFDTIRGRRCSYFSYCFGFRLVGKQQDKRSQILLGEEKLEDIGAISDLATILLAHSQIYTS